MVTVVGDEVRIDDDACLETHTSEMDAPQLDILVVSESSKLYTSNNRVDI